MTRKLWLAPLGAIAGAVGTLVCCLPLGVLGALGAGSLALLLPELRPWLLGASVLLLGVGFVQYWRGARCGVRPHPAGLALLWIAAAVVLGLLLFPQQLASLLAGWGGG